MVRPGHWGVRARVERFVEPALLLLLSERRAHGYELLERIGELIPGERIDMGNVYRLLRERPAHGYELLEQLPALTGEARVDMGNLYRVLRALEEDGLVTSRWEAGEPGPAKRIYELTAAGRRLLDEWAAALRRSRDRIDTFLERFEGR